MHYKRYGKILITRPSCYAEESAAKLRECGYEVVVWPLLSVEFFDLHNINLNTYNAVLLTSQNATASLIKSFAPNPISVFVVGHKSADLLFRAGFQNVKQIFENAQQMFEFLGNNQNFHSSVPSKLTMLYMRGEEISLDFKKALASLNSNVIIDEIYCYKMNKIHYTNDAVTDLISKNDISVVFIYSQNSAKVLLNMLSDNFNEVIAHSIRQITVICMSAAIAKIVVDFSLKFGFIWNDVLFAHELNEDSMINLLH